MTKGQPFLTPSSLGADSPWLPPGPALMIVMVPRRLDFFDGLLGLGRAQMPSATGYSGTPLARKLGLKASSRVLLLGAPEGYAELVEPLPQGVVFERSANPKTNLAHVFVTRREELAKHLSALRQKLNPDAALWVSWPKKSSRVVTTITEDVVREVALPLGFVDVKVCAVTEVWSALKLVLRKELRQDK